MAYQKIQEHLKTIKYLFIFSGMKLHKERGSANFLRYRGAYIFNIVWFNTACSCGFSWLCWGILNNASFTKLSYVAACWIFAMLGNVKTIFYTLNDYEAYGLIEDLIKLDEETKRTDKLDTINELEAADKLDTKETSIVENGIKEAETDFLKKVLKVLKVMYILLMTLYNAGPLVGTAVSYYRSGEIRLFLPFLDIYPFDAANLEYWPYVYIHQFWSVCLVIFYTGSADCFLLTCCTFIRIQFQLVKHDIENIVPSDKNTSFLYREDIHFRNKFQELVIRHQAIISLSKTLREIYSKSILVNVLTSSIVICLTGFNVTVIKEITLVLPSLGFLFTNLLQVFCLCYFGDLMMSSSEEVCTAVYSSKWYLADKEIARKLLFIFARAQISCKLSAAGFMDVNLKAFMRILSTSWSYFALLRTMYSQ